MPPPPPCAEKISVLNAKYQAIKSCLNEKGKRLWAAVGATSYGRDKEDTPDMHDEEKESRLPHFELTRTILGCCFEVMKELGPGFQERVYKNALLIAMRQNGLQVEIEKPFEVIFRDEEETVEESIPF